MKNIRTVYNDPALGTITIIVRSNVRNITMRVKPDGIYVTASPYATTTHIKDVINEFRSRLADKLRKLGPRRMYNPDFRIKTDCLDLSFQKAALSHFTVTSRAGLVIIHYPEGTDFQQNGMQEWLEKVICEAVRKQALIYLPQRLRYLAQRCGLSFNKVTIRGSRSRWGSCSSQRNISLSYYLMTLPSHLIDAVLIHELCHTVEMNHGPRFWALMDTYTNGQAKSLTKEIKQYKTDF